MNRQFWQTLSLTLNLVLVVWVAQVWRQHAAPGVNRRSGPTVAQHRQPIPPTTNPVTTAVVTMNEPFDWQQVASDDYRVFVANLRAVGCPDLTIYDIVSAKVDEMFSLKIKELVDSVTGNFWNLIVSSEDLQSMVKQKEKELDALSDQRREMMAVLFGKTNPVEQLRKAEYADYRLANTKRTLDFLPEDKQTAVMKILKRFDQSRAKLKNSGAKLMATERSKNIAALETERRQTLQTLLTPAEYEEFRLRTSSSAGIRNRLEAFQGTDEEFRAVALAKLNRESEDQIRDLLGPEKYAAYQRAQSKDYRRTLRVTDRFDLPEETAEQIYQIQQEVLAQSRQVRQDSSRTDKERQAVLQAIQTETERSIGQVLGPDKFGTYREYAGAWMEQLTGETPRP